MSHLDALRSAAYIPQAIWLEFVTAYSADSGDLYLFVEGREDVAYFLPLVRQTSLSGRGRVFPCWNKAGVLQALADIKARSPHARRCGFIIDKDLDDLLGTQFDSDPRLLITEYYSLENYLGCDAAVEVIWTDIWGLSQGDNRLDTAKAFAREVLSSLWRVALPVMAWILWHRKRSEKLNLSGVPPKKLFKINQDGRVSRTEDCLEQLRKARSGGAVLQPPTGELVAEAKALRPLAGKVRTRGKYEASMFVAALRMTLDSLNTAKGVKGGRPRRAADVNDASIFSLLAGKLAYPEEFTSFMAAVARD